MDSTELDPGGIADFVGDARSFTAEYWRKQPGVFRSTTSEWSPLTLAAVDEALESGALQSCYVDLTKAGGSAPADAYSSSRTVHQTAYPGFVDATKVRTLLDDGYTLLLRCAEQWHGPTAALTRALGAELGRHVEAFFFVTPPGQQGLPLHRDDADVLVHQVSGSKEWHVHGGPAGADWRPGPVQSDGEPLLTTVLNAGEVLYIPRGFAHRATGQRGLSAHLSLTIREIGTVELFKALQRLITRELKSPARPLDDEALTRQAKELIRHLTDRLATLDAAEVIAAARAGQRSQLYRPGRLGLVPLAEELAGAEEPVDDTLAPAVPGTPVSVLPR